MTPHHTRRMPNSDSKYSEILKAARDVFARYGFNKTTLGDIADRAGIGKATLYYYFTNKEQIFTSVVAQESEALLKALIRAIGDCQSADAKLIAFLKTRYAYMRRFKNLHRVSNAVYRELMPMIAWKREDFSNRELRMLTGIIDSGVLLGTFRKVDTELVASAMLASFRGMSAFFIRYGKDEQLFEGLDNLLQVFVDGLRIR